MNVDSFHKLYVHQLKDLYSAEKQLIDALPKMAKAASSPDLQAAFKNHLEETKGQKKRLETIFESLSFSPDGEKCGAMEGLIEEGEDILDTDLEGAALDAGLIVAAQKVEHYEIASYGAVRSAAQLLGFEDAAMMLQQTLDEEGNADKILMDLATTINQEAAEMVTARS